jgi:hypothetical protein
MAQGGEFVVNRASAQQNAGALESINSGGSVAPSTSVVVNISGNVIGEDSWVQDNLLPAINRAVRGGHELEGAV